MSHQMIRVQIENSIYDRLVKNAVDYALISLPYTINRMNLRDYKSRITNIAKGKLSENLFILFCEENEIPVQTEKCQTPFFIPDKRDFILGREEWDIKNNFLKHDDPVLSKNEYLHLPGLIPNRGTWDQWSKKRDCLHAPETDSVCYLFSFMKGWEGDNPFLSIDLSNEQTAFLSYLVKSRDQYKKPYMEDWFWEKMNEKGNGHPYKIQMNFHPEMVICGIAQKKDFDRFYELKPQSFSNGIFKTRIKNMGIQIKDLSSFITLYPRLNEKIKCGVILD
jgi:hypothetical protein